MADTVFIKPIEELDAAIYKYGLQFLNIYRHLYIPINLYLVKPLFNPIAGTIREMTKLENFISVNGMKFMYIEEICQNLRDLHVEARLEPDFISVWDDL